MERKQSPSMFPPYGIRYDPGLKDHPQNNRHGLYNHGNRQYDDFHQRNTGDNIPQHVRIQHGAHYPGMHQHIGALPGMPQHIGAQPGMLQHGGAQPGMPQHGGVQPGMPQHRVAQPGMPQHIGAQPGMPQHVGAQPGMPQLGGVQPGMPQHRVAQPGMPQYLAGQAGMPQHIGAQPGMPQLIGAQPGMSQQGGAQPGMPQHGGVQPGMPQHRVAQPGMPQHIGAQPGMPQHGGARTGMTQHGGPQPVMTQQQGHQPGMLQHGGHLFDMSQHGGAQSGIGTYDGPQSSTSLHGVPQHGMSQNEGLRFGMLQPSPFLYRDNQQALSKHEGSQPGIHHHGSHQFGMNEYGDPHDSVLPHGGHLPGISQQGTTLYKPSQHDICHSRQLGTIQLANATLPSLPPMPPPVIGTPAPSKDCFTKEMLGSIHQPPYNASPAPMDNIQGGDLVESRPRVSGIQRNAQDREHSVHQERYNMQMEACDGQRENTPSPWNGNSSQRMNTFVHSNRIYEQIDENLTQPGRCNIQDDAIFMQKHISSMQKDGPFLHQHELNIQREQSILYQHGPNIQNEGVLMHQNRSVMQNAGAQLFQDTRSDSMCSQRENGNLHWKLQTDQSSVSNSDRDVFQQWLATFLVRRRKTLPSKTRPALVQSIGEARELVYGALKLMSQLTSLCQSLEQTTEDEESWTQGYQKAASIRLELEKTMKRLEEPGYIESVKRKLERVRRKRLRQQRSRQETEEDKKAAERAADREAKIDRWRMQRIHEVEEKKRERELKASADSVLSEVRKMQADTKKMLDVLRSLEKLRKLRKEAAGRKGVFPPPSADETFENHIRRLRTMVQKRTALYDAEERALRDILEGEQEVERQQEKDKRLKKEREKLHQKQQEVDSILFGDPDPLPPFHPLQPFRQFYLQAEHSVVSLVQIRHAWDQFLAPTEHPEASSIPRGWVLPQSPTSDIWATAIQTSE